MAASKKKKIIVLSSLGGIILILILFMVFGKSETGVIVNVEKVIKRDVTQVVTASGKIYPKVEVKISPDVSGEVIELAVVEGQRVKRGDFLARIKPDFYVFQRDQAVASLTSTNAMASSSKAQLEKAKLEFNRVQELYNKKLVSDQDIDAARTTLRVAEESYNANQADITRAQASLDQSLENLKKTSLYAPIDGIISNLTVEKGERVVGTSQFSGTEIMRIADFGNMEVRVDVNENDVINVHVGDTTRIAVDAFKGRTFVGLVSEIAHTPTTKGAGTQEEVTNFPVKIAILNPDKAFRSGLSATADIETNRVKGVWVVPIQSVTLKRDFMRKIEEIQESSSENSSNKEKEIKKDQKQPDKIVYTVVEGLAKSVVVETGISDDRYIEIKSGLNGNEEVVAGSYRAITRDLEDGKKVKVEVPKKMDGSFTSSEVKE